MLTNRTLGRRELGTPPPPSVHYPPPLESGSSPEEFHLEQLFICIFQIVCQNFVMTFRQFLNWSNETSMKPFTFRLELSLFLYSRRSIVTSSLVKLETSYNLTIRHLVGKQIHCYTYKYIVTNTNTLLQIQIQIHR